MDFPLQDYSKIDNTTAESSKKNFTKKKPWRDEIPKIYEPPRDKTYKMTCATSEDSDQPGPVWSESSLCAQ